MSKRFTDTEIWDKEWFMALDLKNKALIRFLYDKCDVAGVWSANFMLATSYIGATITEQDLLNFEGRIVKIGPGKFYVSEFIEFQYGTLSENCKPHLKIIQLLKKYNIRFDHSKGYLYPMDRVEEKEEDKEGEMETDEGGAGETNFILTVNTQKIYDFKKYSAENFQTACERAEMKLNGSYQERFNAFEDRVCGLTYPNSNEVVRYFNNFMNLPESKYQQEKSNGKQKFINTREAAQQSVNDLNAEADRILRGNQT